MKEKRLRNNKGITLIALVVTIIVLIILAVVSINLTLGNNGIVSKAQKASDLQAKAEINSIEELKELCKELNEITMDSSSQTEEEEKEEEETIEVKKATNIGKKVNYVSKNDATLTWRLFYADDNYVYLISSKQQGQEDGTIKEIEAQRTTYGGLGGVGLINQQDASYTGTANITDPFLKSLNSKYFEARGEEGSTDPNAKAIAWFMDQNVWKGYKDEAGNASYAIAGPTVELLVKSFNATASYNEMQQLTVSCGKWGYDVGNANGNLKNTYNHGIYHLTEPESSFWLASPGGNNESESAQGKTIRTSGGNSSYGVTYGVYFGEDFYNLGLRPVVIIPTDKFIAANYTLAAE